MTNADRLRHLFAKSFEPTESEPTGAGFLYRRMPYGAGIAISATERADFLAGFDRRLARLKWLWHPWVALGGAAALALCTQHVMPKAPAGDWGPAADWVPLAVFLAALAVPVGSYLWASEAPHRALKGRPPAVDAVPRREARRRAIDAMSWRLAIWQVVMTALLVAIFLSGKDHSLPSRILGAFSVPALAIALTQLAMKAVWAGPAPRQP